ncbi:MAG: xanthine dehydrogenase family protein subunit M [Deltaproteobacteria bacterium]|nr:xanthine dehydrogenase family protein subunit M [Deltaproteobacteria bacterium]
MRRFELLMPTSLDEASRLLREREGDVKLIAGGASLLILMKSGVYQPSCLVSLQRIPGLADVHFDPGEGLRIGALTTHRVIERSPVVRERLPVLSEMARMVANVRIRNTGTIGGNLCQADSHADPPPLLLALGARVRAKGGKGTRTIPLEEFLLDYYQTALQPDEVVTEVAVPPLPAGSTAAYLRHTVRSAEDFPCIGAAAVVEWQDGICRQVRLVLGGVAAVPQRARQAEALARGRSLTEPLIGQMAEAAAEEVEPISDFYGSAWYKKRMAGVFARRVLLVAWAQRTGR